MKAFFFPAFFEKPVNIQFDEQEADEEVVLFLRQHWFTNVGWIITATFLFLLPLALIVFFGSPVASALGVGLFGITAIPVKIAQALLLLWNLLIFAFVLEKFLGWYFNIYIVTNKHIVDVEFPSLLSRTVNQSQLEDIQGVSSKISGIFGSLFNYGDVNIETAAKGQEITFQYIPFPDLVSDRIQDLQPSGAGTKGPGDVS